MHRRSNDQVARSVVDMLTSPSLGLPRHRSHLYSRRLPCIGTFAWRWARGRAFGFERAGGPSSTGCSVRVAAGRALDVSWTGGPGNRMSREQYSKPATKGARVCLPLSRLCMWPCSEWVTAEEGSRSRSQVSLLRLHVHVRPRRRTVSSRCRSPLTPSPDAKPGWSPSPDARSTRQGQRC